MIAFADLFCGAGGATTGVLLAARRKRIGIKSGVAINHWPVAVETHSANHPKVAHLCEAIEKVDPCAAVPAGRLDLLWASPECTHHSRARGGKPRQNQSRCGASHILTWLDKLYVKNLIIENVPEFVEWGPLDCHGQPIKRQRGESFKAFIASLKARNYNVDYRVLNAADYGDATTRRRLFIIARRKPQKVVWPEPTHRSLEAGTDDLFRKHMKTWRPARDIIDWTDLGMALSQRKRPLKPNTMRRIFAGLEKFCGLSFIVPTNHGERQGQSPRARGVDQPIGTVATSPDHALVNSIILGQQSCAAPRSPDEPLPTIATDGAIALATPFLVQTDNTGGNGKCVRSVDQPAPTTVTNCGLVTTFVLPHEGVHKGNAARSVEKPLPTVTAGRGGGFLVSLAHGRKAGENDSRRAISNRGEYAICRPFLIRLRGTADNQINSCSKSVDEPIDTISVAGKHHALINPFLAKYYGTATVASVDDPLDTVTARDRYLLVNPKANTAQELEIYFRLLKPGELAAAHSFPKKYKFAGNKTAIVKQIGNSNPVELTAALTAAVL